MLGLLSHCMSRMLGLLSHCIGVTFSTSFGLSGLSQHHLAVDQRVHIAVAEAENIGGARLLRFEPTVLFQPSKHSFDVARAEADFVPDSLRADERLPRVDIEVAQNADRHQLVGELKARVA